MDLQQTLAILDINPSNSGLSTGNNAFLGKGKTLKSYSPVNGKLIAQVTSADKQEYQQVVHQSLEAFKFWRSVPAPKRGEIIRQIGNAFRDKKEALGHLVSYEMGKSLQEGLGEVQEMIDIADFAVGLSRQLHGLTMHSERPLHRMYEQYHPLGVVGVISAFNFPVAVWSWNAFLAWVCGDVCVWKPSEKTPLCAIACQKIAAKIFAKNGIPEGVNCIVNGGPEIGKLLSEDANIALVSATGSTVMGKKVAETVGKRLGKTLLELGGNNAMIITPEADLKITLVAAVFGAIGTSGQRCTSTRRLIVHKDIYDDFKAALAQAYTQIKIGSPLNESNHMGPLIDELAVSQYTKTISKAIQQGGKLVYEGGLLEDEERPGGCYVKPCIIEAKNHFTMVQHETFAPIVYLLKYESIEEAIAIQNDVPQGLSSTIMTNNIRESELFLSQQGSDCGIANVNIGTSGAEIGGAFGGEKETGGGRESGSDAWKVYMRRQTNTINYGRGLPLAQGIKFDL
ncbi:MAG: aldehyde dehydrogenase (NAD+) [Saprospiraceae bacterium]|jgi:aldehyde dehydrogenase (NAD+)